MSLITAGIVLIVLGGGTKMALKTYRRIKAKQFFSETTTATPKQFYKGTFLNKMTKREA